MQVTVIIFIIGICIWAGSVIRYSLPDYKNKRCGFSSRKKDPLQQGGTEGDNEE